ncbi:MAG: inclusion body family protein [Flavobacteriaceae bacterium]|nr:inclusion body family protein [Flavobacteriaceae bacterium]
MKSTNQLFILIAVITLLFGSNAYSQNVKIVTLNVNTATVNKDNLATTCNFGQTDGSSNEDFTITVDVGDIIIWQGVSSVNNSTDYVDIKYVKYVKGPNIFDRGQINGNGNKREKVVATARREATKGNEYKYKIKFTVYDSDGNKKGEYHIDPKIQVNK